MNVKDVWCEGVDSIHMAQGRVLISSFVNTIMNLVMYVIINSLLCL
jgi:hypothetical protein